MDNVNIIKFYQNLINNIEDYGYSLDFDDEYLHDRVIIDINTNQALDINGTIYNGAFEIFYGYKNINGNLVSSRETGYISDMYSSTDDGFGNGLYIEENTNDQELKYIYDKLVKILEENELV